MGAGYGLPLGPGLLSLGFETGFDRMDIDPPAGYQSVSPWAEVIPVSFKGLYDIPLGSRFTLGGGFVAGGFIDIAEDVTPGFTPFIGPRLHAGLRLGNVRAEHAWLAYFNGGADFAFQTGETITLPSVGLGIRYTLSKSSRPEVVPVMDFVFSPPDVSGDGTPSALDGAVYPQSATRKIVKWDIVSAPVSGLNASISSEGVFTATLSPGAADAVLTLRATVPDGIEPGKDFIKDFNLTVFAPPPEFIPVAGLAIGAPELTGDGTPYALGGKVSPENSTRRTIRWNIETDPLPQGLTAELSAGGVLTTTLRANSAVTFKVRGTVSGGGGTGQDISQVFDITVQPPPLAGPKMEPGDHPLVTMQDGRKGFILSEFSEYFEADRSDLTKEDINKLDHAAVMLKSYRGSRIVIAGYTAMAGTSQGREEVSRARAEQVASYLAGKGISRERMDVGWFGADYMIAANPKSQNKALNRRAEIVVLVDD
ncbi:hypothetical protein AGMMS49928_00280 [Spirochaetia bacterium]|nr:hypothetical protein AGMMS49928_00280 [Spirochaetia bacterium]